MYRFLVLTALAGCMHLVLGWEWTAGAGLVAGLWIERNGWLLGAAVVAADYLILVLFNYLSSPRAVSVMTETIGGFLGNMPSFLVVAVTVLIGASLGGLSGAAGAALRRLVVENMDRRAARM